MLCKLEPVPLDALEASHFHCYTCFNETAYLFLEFDGIFVNVNAGLVIL